MNEGDDDTATWTESVCGKELEKEMMKARTLGDLARGAFGVLITHAGRADQRRWKVLHHSWSADSYPVAHRAFPLTLIFSLGLISEEQFY